MTSSTTTKTKPKILFNGREVGKVHVEYLTWEPEPFCPHNVCQECLNDEDCPDCDIKSNRVRAFFDTDTSLRHSWIPNGVVEIKFTYDASFLTYEMLDNEGDFLSSEMIPIVLINDIAVRSKLLEGTQQISHLDTEVRKKLK